MVDAHLAAGHPLLPQLHENPFTRRAFTKPRVYTRHRPDIFYLEVRKRTIREE